MLNKNPRFYYDPETCTYVPVRLTTASVLRKVTLGILFVLGVGFAAKSGFDVFLVDAQAAQHLKEQEHLLAVLDEYNVRLDQYETRLNDWYQKSNSFYRPVMGEAQISKGYWNGGRGGSPLYDRTDNTLLNTTQLRLERLSHQIELLDRSYDRVRSRADNKESEMRNLPSIMPVNGALISGFGVRTHPVTGHQKLHEGVDFACGIGTPIYAPGDGLIETTGDIANGYGININIDHQNGYKTKFAHLSRSLVQPGERVSRGQLIGYSGNTGLSTGPHLHYEIIHNDVKIDPIDFFYQDLPPSEFRRLKLDKTDSLRSALKEKINAAPAMD